MEARFFSLVYEHLLQIHWNTVLAWLELPVTYIIISSNLKCSK